MRCPICFEHIKDAGDGYRCKKCGYFLEYCEIEDCEDEICTDECYIEYEEGYYDKKNDEEH